MITKKKRKITRLNKLENEQVQQSMERLTRRCPRRYEELILERRMPLLNLQLRSFKFQLETWPSFNNSTKFWEASKEAEPYSMPNRLACSSNSTKSSKLNSIQRQLQSWNTCDTIQHVMYTSLMSRITNTSLQLQQPKSRTILQKIF